VVAAREALPVTSLTSAQTRGGLTSRGRESIAGESGRGKGTGRARFKCK
jgi:hypothetical protein